MSESYDWNKRFHLYSEVYWDKPNSDFKEGLPPRPLKAGKYVYDVKFIGDFPIQPFMTRLAITVDKIDLMEDDPFNKRKIEIDELIRWLDKYEDEKKYTTDLDGISEAIKQRLEELEKWNNKL